MTDKGEHTDSAAHPAMCQQSGELGFEREIERVLAGDGSYDSLTSQEQDVVRREWEARIGQRLSEVNLQVAFEAAGETWVEGDPEGRLVERKPGSRDDGYELNDGAG